MVREALGYATTESGRALDLGAGALRNSRFLADAGFELVVRNIIASLNPGGLFCGNLSGKEDEWSSDPEMTFVDRTMVDDLFQGMEMIKLEEFRSDTKMALGGSKWSHQYYIIAKKPITK